MSRFNVGGTSQWLFQLGSELSSHGIENLLVVGDCPPGENEDWRLSQVNYIRIKGLGPKANLFESVSAIFQLRRLIKDYSPTIINTHTSKAGVIGRIAGKTACCRSVMIHTYHGHLFYGYFNQFIVIFVWLVEFSLSLVTDYFFVAGNKVLKTLQEAKIVRGFNYLLVWPGVPQFSLSPRQTVRTKFGISEDAIVVGWLGRKVKIKRIDRILEIAKHFPEIKFLIAGDGASIKTSYPQYFTEGEGLNVIEMENSSPQEVWSASDIALLTSDNEAMPISLIEASLACLPIVAVDVGSVSEVAIDGLTSILCSADNNDLVNAIQRLIHRKDLRDKMGIAGHNFVSKRFNVGDSFDNQLQGYKTALSAKEN